MLLSVLDRPVDSELTLLFVLDRPVDSEPMLLFALDRPVDNEPTPSTASSLGYLCSTARRQ